MDPATACRSYIYQDIINVLTDEPSHNSYTLPPKTKMPQLLVCNGDFYFISGNMGKWKTVSRTSKHGRSLRFVFEHLSTSSNLC